MSSENLEKYRTGVAVVAWVLRKARDLIEFVIYARAERDRLWRERQGQALARECDCMGKDS